MLTTNIWTRWKSSRAVVRIYVQFLMDDLTDDIITVLSLSLSTLNSSFTIYWILLWWQTLSSSAGGHRLRLNLKKMQQRLWGSNVKVSSSGGFPLCRENGVLFENPRCVQKADQVRSQRASVWGFEAWSENSTSGMLRSDQITAN